MKETLLYAAFCGTGKTYICQQTDISAVEIEYWKYKDIRPNDYVNDIKEHFGKVDYIFISTDPEGLRILNENGFKITLIYPLNELRGEYLDRYIDRDSPSDFIGAFMKYWNPWIDELKEQSYCDHIVLKGGQYLKDII
jgi:hypothetical protein